MKQLHTPPENLRARELDPANVAKVKQELEIKGEVGALLQIICVVPPVMFPVITVTCFRAR